MWDKINEHTDQGLWLQVAWVEAHTTDKHKEQMTRLPWPLKWLNMVRKEGHAAVKYAATAHEVEDLVGMDEFSEGMMHMHKPKEQVNVKE